MLRTAGLVLALSLVVACGEDQQATAEGASLEACTQEVEQRTGEDVSQAQPPWRITSRAEGNGFVVSIWTTTAQDASRPTGPPDHVCTTARSANRQGVDVVDVRP